MARGLKPIPDNSEPWLPGGVRSMADAIWISDQTDRKAMGNPITTAGLIKDLQDIASLEAKVEREYLEKLPQADETTARHMLDRVSSTNSRKKATPLRLRDSEKVTITLVVSHNLNEVACG